MVSPAGKNAVTPSDSQADSSAAQTDAIRIGWLIGYSYNACQNLYFKVVHLPDLPNWTQKPNEKDLKGLLSYLYTYLSLADELKVDDDHKKLIENMINNVEEIWLAEHKNPHETVQDLKKHKLVEVPFGQFEALYQSIEGITRARNQYSLYAMEFSACANALINQWEKESRTKAIEGLKDSLSNLKKFVSKSAYSVLQNDIDQIRRDIDSPIGIQTNLAFNIDIDRTGDWKDLILGTRSVSDILTVEGERDVDLLVVLIGVLILLAAFSLGGLGLYYLVRWIASVLKISSSSITLSNVKDFVSTMGTLVTIFTGLGLSLSVVVQKSWDGLKSLESSLAIYFAKQSRFRNACQKTGFVEGFRNALQKLSKRS